MPRTFSINKLPADVKAEFHAKLVESRFSGVVALSDWLQSRGFAVSKNGVHRYITANKSSILREINPSTFDAVTQIRMRCVEVASRHATSNTDLLALSDAIFTWVNRA